MTNVSPNNLTRIAHKTAEDAGLTPRPKFYRAMRSSCEDDWKKIGIAEPTHCTWLGHSPAVSRQHYVAPTAAEFEVVTKEK